MGHRRCGRTRLGNLGFKLNNTFPSPSDSWRPLHQALWIEEHQRTKIPHIGGPKKITDETIDRQKIARTDRSRLVRVYPRNSQSSHHAFKNVAMPVARGH